ncbi:MAG: flagellar motor switch protein FliM [Planctomycetia bacterium]|nr:flagellar motor switch protein FliM [Planctomycetia bacterium]
MGAENLSQAERESLRGGTEAIPSAPAEAAAPAPAKPSPSRRSNVSHADGKRGAHVPSDLLQALDELHQRFARTAAVALSAAVRAPVELKFAGTEQLIYCELYDRLENPTCCNLLSAPPLAERVVLDVGLSILFPMIDRLLGGGQESEPPPRRPLTDIELRLAARVTSLLLAELRRAWEGVLPLDLQTVRVESSPRLVQAMPAAEPAVLVCFELAIGQERGLVHLCIPQAAIARIGGKLAGLASAASDRHEPTRIAGRRAGDATSRAVVDVAVHVAETRISTSDLLGLCPGDIITTEKNATSPLVVTVEGVPTFRARAGMHAGHKAVAIVERIEPGHPA